VFRKFEMHVSKPASEQRLHRPQFGEHAWMRGDMVDGFPFELMEFWLNGYVL
jgi:hypothetical protein